MPHSHKMVAASPASCPLSPEEEEEEEWEVGKGKKRKKRRRKRRKKYGTQIGKVRSFQKSLLPLPSTPGYSCIKEATSCRGSGRLRLEASVHTAACKVLGSLSKERGEWVWSPSPLSTGLGSQKGDPTIPCCGSWDASEWPSGPTRHYQTGVRDTTEYQHHWARQGTTPYSRPRFVELPLGVVKQRSLFETQSSWGGPPGPHGEVPARVSLSITCSVGLALRVAPVLQQGLRSRKSILAPLRNPCEENPLLVFLSHQSQIRLGFSDTPCVSNKNDSYISETKSPTS